jgi:type II secretory pathway component PulM
MRLRLRLPGPVLWTAVVALLAVVWMTFVVPLGDGLDEAEHVFRA